MTTTTLADEGVLRLDRELSKDSVGPLIDAILEHNLEGGREFLRLYINTPGGDVDQGFALIDIMCWSRIPIRTTAMGLVASMGLLVLMAGTRGQRTVMPHCSLLSHRFATITGGTHADLLAARRQQDLLHLRIVDHYRACTALTDIAAIERELLPTTDRWLSPDEAVSYGIVDRVWARDLSEDP
jgi:ATP-dependent Clp protease protease subunit